MHHDDEDPGMLELDIELADGQIVSLEVHDRVRQLLAEGHTITVDPAAGAVRVEPPVDEDSVDLLETDWTGVAAILAEPAPGIH